MNEIKKEINNIKISELEKIENIEKLPKWIKDNFNIFFEEKVRKIYKNTYDSKKLSKEIEKLSTQKKVYKIYNKTIKLSYLEIFIYQIFNNFGENEKLISIIKNQFCESDEEKTKISMLLWENKLQNKIEKLWIFLLTSGLAINILFSNHKISSIIILSILIYLAIKYLYKKQFGIKLNIKPAFKLWLSGFMFISFINFSPIFETEESNNYFELAQNYFSESIEKGDFYANIYNNKNNSKKEVNKKSVTGNKLIDNMHSARKEKEEKNTKKTEYILKSYQTIYDIANKHIDSSIKWKEREVKILEKAKEYIANNRDTIRAAVAANGYKAWWLSDLELVKYLPSWIKIEIN